MKRQEANENNKEEKKVDSILEFVHKFGKKIVRITKMKKFQMGTCYYRRPKKNMKTT